MGVEAVALHKSVILTEEWAPFLLFYEVVFNVLTVLFQATRGGKAPFVTVWLLGQQADIKLGLYIKLMHWKWPE